MRNCWKPGTAFVAAFVLLGMAGPSARAQTAPRNQPRSAVRTPATAGNNAQPVSANRAPSTSVQPGRTFYRPGARSPYAAGPGPTRQPAAAPQDYSRSGLFGRTPRTASASARRAPGQTNGGMLGGTRLATEGSQATRNRSSSLRPGITDPQNRAVNRPGSQQTAKRAPDLSSIKVTVRSSQSGGVNFGGSPPATGTHTSQLAPDEHQTWPDMPPNTTVGTTRWRHGDWRGRYALYGGQVVVVDGSGGFVLGADVNGLDRERLNGGVYRGAAPWDYASGFR